MHTLSNEARGAEVVDGDDDEADDHHRGHYDEDDWASPSTRQLDQRHEWIITLGATGSGPMAASVPATTNAVGQVLELPDLNAE